MKKALVTGSCGLIGSQAVRRLAQAGFDVTGVDNNLRRTFFGPDGCTDWNREQLQRDCGPAYRHEAFDIRDAARVGALMRENAFALVLHTAAQPSHDWAARDPMTDFGVNALGTLTLLEAFRQHRPEAVFVFMSTNKVYGDRPNALPLVELETRYEIDPAHPFCGGIDETMSIDACTHSLFGVSKASADLLVQEYGRYFGLRTACFRGGCLTGPSHSGAKLHGFLSYLVKCAVKGEEYAVLGYKGKQVRDNIHSEDLVDALLAFYERPRCGEVYNIGGGRDSNISVLEALDRVGKILGRPVRSRYEETPRIGDHIWYVSSNAKFQSHYPGWKIRHTIDDILVSLCRARVGRN